MLPTTKAQKMPRLPAFKKLPPAAKMTTAGPQTRAVPIPGMIESTAMIVPQNTALGIPTTQNAIPAKPPCNIPTMVVPFRVARVTEVNFSNFVQAVRHWHYSIQLTLDFLQRSVLLHPASDEFYSKAILTFPNLFEHPAFDQCLRSKLYFPRT